MKINKLANLVTGRSQSLFEQDVKTHEKEICSAINGSRILVIGGAGSIGSATVQQILNYKPRSLHVVDQSENNLAELVRSLRSNKGGLTVDDFRALPLNFGSQIMHRFVREQPPYDTVLNFAALKHVRTEKDAYCLLQMLDTNVVMTARLLKLFVELAGTHRFFSVSTDKAANPVNMMGASKRLMEHVMFSDEICNGSIPNVTSARFANVAFSEGSLPQSFLKRYESRQPLSLPRATSRYFISMEEAGEICLLSAFCEYNRLVIIPKLIPSKHMCTLENVAKCVLKYYGLKPRIYNDENEAKERVSSDYDNGYYPLFMTELDTSGEKSYEEFVGHDEEIVDLRFNNLAGVKYKSLLMGRITEVVSSLESIIISNSKVVTKVELVRLISDILPEFNHLETGLNLDQRI